MELEEKTFDMQEESEASIYDEIASLYVFFTMILDSIVTHYLPNRCTYSSFSDWSSLHG